MGFWFYQHRDKPQAKCCLMNDFLNGYCNLNERMWPASEKNPWARQAGRFWRLYKLGLDFLYSWLPTFLLDVLAGPLILTWYAGERGHFCVVKSFTRISAIQCAVKTHGSIFLASWQFLSWLGMPNASHQACLAAQTPDNNTIFVLTAWHSDIK